MIVYILMQLLKIFQKIVTNKALQRIFIVSLCAMIVLDSAGIFTFNELWNAMFAGIVEAISVSVQSLVEWVNNQIIGYIRNEVLSL